MTNDLVERLRKRAEIRRQIPSRKSVQEGKPDRVADLLDEAANEIERLSKKPLPLSPELDKAIEEFIAAHPPSLIKGGSSSE